MSYFCCDKCGGTFDPQFTYCPVCEDVPLIEQLQAKNAELTTEVEEQRSDHLKLVEENHELRKKLAIAEEHNARLRNAIGSLQGMESDADFSYAWDLINKALSLPASREALDAFVAEKVKEAKAEVLGQVRHFKRVREQRDLAVEVLKICRGIGSVNEEKRMNFLNSIENS